jgi:hypothetical protein
MLKLAFLVTFNVTAIHYGREVEAIPTSIALCITYSEEWKMQTPERKPKVPTKKEHEEPYNRDYLPMWCRGIMGGCVNCGGCV